jgi:hypothetical protein
MSCIAVTVVTTVLGVASRYSHTTMLNGVTEPIKTNEFCTMFDMTSSSICLGSEVEASSIVNTKLPAAMAVTTLSRSTARRASSKLAACKWYSSH